MDPYRKRASQTESAVMWDLAVGTLRSWYAEAAFDIRNMLYGFLNQATRVGVSVYMR